jgi:hypothetical protein
MVFIVLARVRGDLGPGHYSFDFNSIPMEHYRDAWTKLLDIIDAVGGRLGDCGDGMPKYSCKTVLPVAADNVTTFFNNGKPQELTAAVVMHWR